jgi:AAA domain/Mu B transposition protein, C terminal
MQTVEQTDDERARAQAEVRAAYEAGQVRWKHLTDRIADEIARGYSLARIVTEAELNRIGEGRDHVLSIDRLRAWCERYGALRSENRYVGQPVLAEAIEAKLAAWFALLDTERAANQTSTPPLVKTAVTLKVWSGFEDARELCEMVEIDAPPGTGKTCATEQYLAQCRKLEGFTCPVWRISANGTILSLKNILRLIACEIDEDYLDAHYNHQDHETMRWIEAQTEGRGGLLIVDEAQHIGDAVAIQGINILNCLRVFTDKKLFGIAFLSNGEVYRRVAGGKHRQLSSRMEAWRVTIKGVPDEDVDAIMAAYGVSGKDARAWCVKKASGVGGLRALVNAFRKAQGKFCEVNHQTLTLLERC